MKEEGIPGGMLSSLLARIVVESLICSDGNDSHM